ncbi:MAG TPA: S41 family peptidase [candidate division Zixibacteria bacterium]|nr:S41 family peptidase [candidate division Zixibacteria bacterium]
MNNNSDLGKKLDKEMKLEILREISKKVLEMYVFNDVAKEIEKKLTKNYNDGLFDNITDIQIFANEINEILQEISKDKHLTIRYDVTIMNRMIALREANQEEIEKIKQEQIEFFREINFGFKRLEILEGNIGYLDLIGFARSIDASETAIAAMKFLAYTNSIIIDLRNNNGGEPEMVRFLASYFLEPGILWNTIIWSYKNSTEELWILDKVTGKRMNEKDLYILTSKDTFSGGEDFAYGMKCLKRATLIGETTKGGAHPTDGFSILDLLVFNIPNGRSINPISKTNWESVGVEPDISIDADLALNKAFELALNKYKR